jgi:hypothetical protein
MAASPLSIGGHRQGLAGFHAEAEQGPAAGTVLPGCLQSGLGRRRQRRAPCASHRIPSRQLPGAHPAPCESPPARRCPAQQTSPRRCARAWTTKRGRRGRGREGQGVVGGQGAVTGGRCTAAAPLRRRAQRAANRQRRRVVLAARAAPGPAPALPKAAALGAGAACGGLRTLRGGLGSAGPSHASRWGIWLSSAATLRPHLAGPIPGARQAGVERVNRPVQRYPI